MIFPLYIWYTSQEKARVERDAKNLTSLNEIFSPKRAHLVGKRIGSAHDQTENVRELEHGM